MLTYRAPGSVDDRFCRAVMTGHPAADAEEAAENAADNAEASARSGGGARPGAAPLYAVSSYLRHQGRKFVQRFDANCYVALTHTLDSHDVAATPGARLMPVLASEPPAEEAGDGGGGGGDDDDLDARYDAILRALPQRALVVGIDSDVLYPLPLQRRLAGEIPRGELYVISSPHGHDSFLIEIERLNAAVARFRAGGPAHGMGEPEDAAEAEAEAEEAPAEVRAARAAAALAEARAAAERDAYELKRLRAKLAEVERKAAKAREDVVVENTPGMESMASMEGTSSGGGEAPGGSSGEPTTRHTGAGRDWRPRRPGGRWLTSHGRRRRSTGRWRRPRRRAGSRHGGLTRSEINIFYT